jgi:mannitol-1-/sugar-/sorbitol-6-/2-deoxyglucose-6-phosphatase
MKNNFQAIIFDMDGTLVASEPIWEQAETKLLADRGHVYTPQARAQIIGLRIDASVAKFKHIYSLEDDVIDLYHEVNNNFLELIRHVAPARGASELLAYVMDNDIPHAIASASPQVIIDEVVEAMGWLDIFPIRCSADDEPHGKPAPDVYITAARKVGVAPADCLALEDSANGARSAVAAGMTCYAIPDLSHSTADFFREITPHLYNDLHEVLAALRD